jgi:hypothetical protein
MGIMENFHNHLMLRDFENAFFVIRRARLSPLPTPVVAAESVKLLSSMFEWLQLLRIFWAMVFFNRVVVTGSGVDRVSAVCCALAGLLHPLRYPGQFAPVVPRSERHILQFPGSFLLGYTQLTDEADSYTTIVDVDEVSIGGFVCDKIVERAVQRVTPDPPLSAADFREAFVRAIASGMGSNPDDHAAMAARYDDFRRGGHQVGLADAVRGSQAVQQLMQAAAERDADVLAAYWR